MKYLIALTLALPVLGLSQTPVTQVMDSQRNYYTLYDDGTYEKIERKDKRLEGAIPENNVNIVNGTQTDSITAIYVNGVNLSEVDIQYIQVIGVGRGLLGNRLEVVVDFGQKIRLLGSSDQVDLKDQNGSNIEFNTMIDALNLLSKFGFEHIHAYAVPGGNGSVYTHLLRRSTSP